VNVPHSCAVNPENTGWFSELIDPTDIAKQQIRRAQDIARKEVGIVVTAGPPEIVSDSL
jgi:hypothetical protein